MLPKDKFAEEANEGKIGCETAFSLTDTGSDGGGDITDWAFDLGGGRSFLATLEGVGLSFTDSGGGACCIALLASCLFQRSLSRDSFSNFALRRSASSFSARYALILALGPD